MALIIRIDVDRPYGRSPLFRHLLSRLSSDLYFPKIGFLGYLKELAIILNILNTHKRAAYIFFRRCTLPPESIIQLVHAGGHEVGLHLENSRSFDTLIAEKDALERHIGKPISAFSKHGSGGHKYGLRHYAPYEPEKYVEWAQRCGMRVFFGNLEDANLPPHFEMSGLAVFPSAFWLEPNWRDTKLFTIDWLIARARESDVVLLIHPENILSEHALTMDFERLLISLESRIIA